MRIPYMENIVNGDIRKYTIEVENQFAEGKINEKQYHMAMGKALAYTEIQFVMGEISNYTAQEIIDYIEEIN